MNSSFNRSSTRLTQCEILALGPMALAGAAVLQRLAFAQSCETEFVEVKTRHGSLRGARDIGVAIFKGVPYGGSVSGANRFKAAPPLKPWTGIRDALQLAAPSPQPGRTGSAREPAPDEDCLFLNVWSPGPAGRKRPVMFYSHGGAFTSGSGGSAYQDGANLARTCDVVVVASNHRLGLEKSDWRKLLEVPLDKLVAAQGSLGQSPGGGPLTMTGGRKGMTGGDRPGGFGPIIDGAVLPRHPFDPEAPAISKNKPLIIGYNRDETIFFLQRNTEVFNLTDATLKERLAREAGANADTVKE